MKKLKQILLVAICTALIFTPCYVKAVGEETTEESEQTGEITGGSNEEGENNPSEDEIKITLNSTKLELGTEKEHTLIATVSPSNSKIEWSSSDETIATVDQNGKITTKTKAGTTTITATIKDTSKSATCTVNVTRTIGKDASLKSLTISNGKLDKTFQSDVLEYTVTINEDVTKLEYEYELTDNNASFFGPSNKNLKNGDKLELKVIAEDGTTNRIYVLNIIKNETSLNLKKLEINGYALNEVFDPSILEYTASIPYEIETISITATAEDSNVTVKTSGLSNLIVGNNTVKVTVTDSEGNSQVYKITVTREKEVSVEENPTSIITSSNTDNENQSSSEATANSNSNSSDNDFLKYAIVSLACFILFAIGGIGIYFYLKTSPKKLKKELQKSKKTDSPIVEIENEQPKQESSIGETMQENLVQTKEFNTENLQENSKPENLFNDDKDV